MFRKLLNFNLIGIIVVLILSSCASKDLSKTLKSKAYVDYISYQNLKNQKREGSLRCPKYKKLYKNRNWKKIILMANDCVERAEWANLQKLSYFMAQKFPYSPWGMYYLSLYSENKKDFENSLWMVDGALKKAPNLAMFSYQKGRILWKLKQAQRAVVEFNKAIELDSMISPAHNFLGQIYIKEQKYKKAISHFKISLEERRYSRFALKGLGEAYFNLNQYEESLKYLSRAMSFFPFDLRIRIRQAYIYEKIKGETKKALLIYEKIKFLQTKGKIKKNKDFDVSLKIESLKLILIENNKRRKISSSEKT